MPRDLTRELTVLRNRMAQCFRETLLARDLRPAVLLAVIGLHLTLKDINRTRDPTKRRELIREFDRGRTAILKIIDRAYQETSSRPNQTRTDHRKPRAAQQPPDLFHPSTKGVRHEPHHPDRRVAQPQRPDPVHVQL